ncbi:fibrinogen-like YCDxxxxGGGW domain-containing protein [Pseudoalteromonas luteoviolacea]|uniref:fibrinogen-like YCDxxxxGGGW domain-containing protein n=1 Tax=Pseudoalteromonas luteoviolacea TaxID=43657 RepID=UPI0011518EA5|nr:fibrinogen-like YCDxxxxGGGW domain-containing protein [Pseudoalteromonas luteoviolacea]TQF71407.1 hypothetical protein FLM44_10035 [Pseudoalteromonas luteoviolacea]
MKKTLVFGITSAALAANLSVMKQACAQTITDPQPSVISDTDWQETSTNVTTLKNVGIGMTSPTEALRVIGNAIADDPLQPSHLVTKRYLDTQLQSVIAQSDAQQQQIKSLLQRVSALESQYQNVRNDYIQVVARLDEVESTLSPSGRNCLDIKTQLPVAATGFYLIDPDGENIGVDAFKVWCDMDYQGGGWTLFANHKDNIVNIQEGEVISPAEFSVMKAQRWQALRQTVSGGMMFKDEHGRITQVYQAKMNNANCRNIYTEDNLAALSTLGDYGLIWHHEDTNCNVSWDFAGVILGDKDSTRVESYTYQGASVLQAPNSKTRFDVWPYGSDESSRHHQNELLYFVK